MAVHNKRKAVRKMKPEAKIKKYLDERGISQAFISRKTGISTVKLNLALNGNRKLSLDEYELICGALGVPPDHFLTPRSKTKN